MRVLALDYGSARCGCAVCDPTETIVTPIEQVEHPATKRGLAALRALVREREIDHVLVGLPLSLDGSDSGQTREARTFAGRLGEHMPEGVAVELYDERYTTRLAQRMTRRAGILGRQGHASEDSVAAAHLLEAWLAARSR
jgi:putative Holliday junction resolvase